MPVDHFFTQDYRVSKEIVGVDLDENGISTLKKLMPNHEFINHNIEKLDTCTNLTGRKFDLIIAADVYEHLYNIGDFLDGARKLLNTNGQLLLTTPNSFFPKTNAPNDFLGF